MGWRGLKERIFYEPVERYTWTAAHHDDEMKSGPNILLIFTGYIVQACRYVPPISHFFLFSFLFFSFCPFETRSHIPIHTDVRLCVIQAKRDRKFEERVTGYQSMNTSSHGYRHGGVF